MKTDDDSTIDRHGFAVIATLVALYLLAVFAFATS